MKTREQFEIEFAQDALDGNYYAFHVSKDYPDLCANDLPFCLDTIGPFATSDDADEWIKLNAHGTWDGFWYINFVPTPETLA